MGHHMITRSKKQMITRSKEAGFKPGVVLTQTKRKQRRKHLLFPTRNSCLPIELVTEILSWLSVHCLLRLKTVCRQWYELIQERKFIEKHMNRSKMFCYYYNKYKENKDTFEWKLSFDGLVLERSLASKKYRIRNLATRKIFDVPDSDHKSVDMNICFVRDCGYYKAVSLYIRKERDNCTSGFEILTIGSEENPSWRALDTAFFRNLNTQKEDVWSLSASGVAYYVRRNKTEPLNYEVLSLDLSSERFTSSTVDKNSFSNNKNDVYVVQWEKKLSLAEIENNELHILVYQDYRKGEWAKEKVVIPLKILIENPELLKTKDLHPTHASNSYVFFSMKRSKHYFVYSIEKEKLFPDPMLAMPSKEEDAILSVRQSLVDFKGMREL